jgi:hypothetical protein
MMVTRRLFKMMKTKKGVFDQLGALGIGVVTLAITLVVVFLIMSQVGANTTVAADGNATATVTTLTEAAADIPGWVPIVVIVAIGALLLGLIAVFRRS